MKKLRLLLITLCVSVLMGSMAVTAYAGGGEEWDGLDPEPEQPKATGSGGMLLLALAVVVIGGGAGWYFKIYRPKKQRAAESEADYGGEYDGAENYDETDPEDDGPPWDEDGEE